MKYCDSCLTVAYDEVGPDSGEQDQFLDAFSGMAMLADHACDRIETDGEISCKCSDHRRK